MMIGGWQDKIYNASVRGDVPLYFLLLTKYVVGRNFKETDEAGEITRLNGYHERYYFCLNLFSYKQDTLSLFFVQRKKCRLKLKS